MLSSCALSEGVPGVRSLTPMIVKCMRQIAHTHSKLAVPQPRTVSDLRCILDGEHFPLAVSCERANGLVLTMLSSSSSGTLHRQWRDGHRAQWSLQNGMATRAKSACTLRGPRVTLTRDPPLREVDIIDTSLADEMLGLLRSGDKEATLACEQNGIDASMLEAMPSESLGVGSAEVLKMREASHGKRRAALARIIQQRRKLLQAESRRAAASKSRASLRDAPSHGLLAHLGTTSSAEMNVANGQTSSWMLGITSECPLSLSPRSCAPPKLCGSSAMQLRR